VNLKKYSQNQGIGSRIATVTRKWTEKLQLAGADRNEKVEGTSGWRQRRRDCVGLLHLHVQCNAMQELSGSEADFKNQFCCRMVSVNFQERKGRYM
jgi:hypothetical protein